MATEELTDSVRVAALAAFRPDRFGFQPLALGWVKELAGLGPVVITGLGWQHAQLRLPAAAEAAGDVLELVVELQRQTWGMAPEELVPANVLAVLAESGGSVLVAYQQEFGFTPAGWLGFAISLGADNGTLVSHMLGVRPDARGRHDIGWHLKVVQGYEGLRRGYHAATWTFDPMRGANARLNLEKLGAVVRELTLDKYGTLRSDLYGDVPSDRFTAHWPLLAPATAQRLQLVATERYRQPGPAEVRDVPLVTAASVDAVLTERPARLGYRIPGDVDRLMRDDPAAAIAWRQEMRQVFSRLLTTKAACLEPSASLDPTRVTVAVSPGSYAVTGLATWLDSAGERESVYLLQREHGSGEIDT